jgi:hypothetical protein
MVLVVCRDILSFDARINSILVETESGHLARILLSAGHGLRAPKAFPEVQIGLPEVYVEALAETVTTRG